MADLFRQRWQVEIDIRSLKTHMAMDHLRCHSPEMVRKGIYCHMLAYNLDPKLTHSAASRLGGFGASLSPQVAAWHRPLRSYPDRLVVLNRPPLRPKRQGTFCTAVLCGCFASTLRAARAEVLNREAMACGSLGRKSQERWHQHRIVAKRRHARITLRSPFRKRTADLRIVFDCVFYEKTEILRFESLLSSLRDYVMGALGTWDLHPRLTHSVASRLGGFEASLNPQVNGEKGRMARG